MLTRMVKISDVAEEAGVSTATVSRVLNGNPRVDPSLVQQVHEAADKLGYRLNALGRNLRQQRTTVWVLIVSDIENPFFTSIARGVEDIAQKNGFSVVLCNSDEDPVKEAKYLVVAEQEQAAGVILSPHSKSTDVTGLKEASIPLVTIDRLLDSSVDSVVVNSRGGARTATSHLLEQGWKRPACVTGPSDATTAMERAEGYELALADRGLTDRSMVVNRQFRAEGGRAAVAELLDAGHPPDSFFVANSNLALGVLTELNIRGLQIGHDIGLVMFDDAPWAPFIDPPISVVAQPVYDIGSRAARLLTERILEPHGAMCTSIVLETTLVVRGSSLRPLG